MTKKLNIKTNKIVRPVIYCFTTPNDHTHDGYCKIGYTDRETADECIYHESRRTDTLCVKHWEDVAMFGNGSYEPFTDHDFHKYLELLGIERKNSEYKGTRKPEYFKITPDEAKFYFDKFRQMVMPDEIKKNYVLRDEQQDAVKLTQSYMSLSDKKEVLLNAKPRFGKTLTVYDYCKQIKAQNILILTNRPVIATSWYNDYVKFLGTDDYIFVSNCDVVKNLQHCYSREKYLEDLRSRTSEKSRRCIEFVSLQDLKGSKWFGGHYDKLREVADINWDVLVVDESHEGVDTFKTNIAFKRIKRNETIYLSGTPFKQIASERFPKEAIYNWTYAQEQEKKANWDYSLDEVNPYEELPQLNLFTYRLSEMFLDEDRLNEDNSRDKFFNLNEFFKTNERGSFIYNSDVDVFLETITTVEKYPLANNETKSQIKHSLWLMDRVDSAKALAKKLKIHPKFKEYEIIVAAGDGKIDDNEKVDNSFKKVTDAIAKYDKTITISVGQLTTGITIPEWSAVFMLCNVKSPSLYIQASFRAQNPCKISNGDGTFTQKEHAYIFDFDPARTLDIMEQFANDLYSDTTSGKGNTSQRAHNIEQLIKYFPIVGEDDNGELINYKPEDVIAIPAKIHSMEIVRHGFMSNFLFQNVGRIFNDSKAMEILSNVEEYKGVHTPAPSTENLNFDENGNTKVNEDKVEAKIKEVSDEVDKQISKDEASDAALNLGEKLNPCESFMDTLNKMKTSQTAEEKKERDSIIDTYVQERADRIKDVITSSIGKAYEGGIFNTKKIEKDIATQYTEKVREAKVDHEIEMEKLRKKFDEARRASTDKEEVKRLVKEFSSQRDDLEFDFACEMEALENRFKTETIADTVKEIETKKQEKENKKAEDDYAFPKLKAFSRSIPSFLMAYGYEGMTCDKFGEIIPPSIFKEMTGIKLSDYMYFIEKEYFNEVAFNDAIKEFFNVKNRLSDYFAEDKTEDIFDYIPLQRTNQKFTPKFMVVQMVAALEENNPGCFDRDDKTFIDIYMKSGLFITEIVKKLYRSEKMKELYPDNKERLKHIFEHQVYGLAPTEIIYKIATNFIFGSELTKDINTSHFVMFNAQPYAEAGTLEQELDKIFK